MMEEDVMLTQTWRTLRDFFFLNIEHKTNAQLNFLNLILEKDMFMFNQLTVMCLTSA